MKILFYTGYSKDKWNKQTWESEGIGGSEYCVIKLAEYLAKEGHTVVVTGNVEGCYMNKVTYVDYEAVLNKGNERGANSIAFTVFDWAIGVNYIHYMEALDGASLYYKKSLFWMHNTDFHDWYLGNKMDNARELLGSEKMNGIVCVSEWQREYIKKEYSSSFIHNNIDPNTYIHVVNNAIDLSDWDDINDEKVKDRIIYSSATDRGLDSLLEMFPTLKNNNPNLSLHICTPPYSEKWGYDVPELDGVKWLGALRPKQLYSEISKAEYWLYPSVYPETFCISALEMMIGGVKMLSTNTGNLDNLITPFANIIDLESTAGYGIKGYEDITRGDIQNKMTAAMNRNNGACHDDKAYHYEWYRKTSNAKKWVKFQTWDIRVHDWITLLNNNR
jgi:glycosyltransferase involved in cell wall biosynthesis|tara:strand:- start:237 stop:1400 length:1164 start_codon:yes stop_codon:yes gene_type:complete